MSRTTKKIGAPPKPRIACSAQLVSVGPIKFPDDTKIEEKAEEGKPAFSALPLKFNIMEDYPFREVDYNIYFHEDMLADDFDISDHIDNKSFTWSWRQFFGDIEKPTVLDAVVEDDEEFWATVDEAENKSEGFRQAFLANVGRTFGVTFSQQRDRVQDDEGNYKTVLKDRYEVRGFFGNNAVERMEQSAEKQREANEKDPTKPVRFRIAWEEGELDDLDYEGFNAKG